MSFLSNARDKAIKLFFQRNEFINKFGEIESVDIDTQENIATIAILLHGETEPTKLYAHYYFEDGEQGTEIVINKVDCERELINAIATWWFKGNTIKKALPKGAGLFAKILF